MKQQFRLTSGGRVDRSRTLSFSFDGRKLEGHPGDTLASALLANGVRVVGRSFKYHRPRGVVTAGVEEPCALVQIVGGPRTRPNLPATVVPLSDGLIAESVNRWPSLHLDVGAMAQMAAPLLPAGFYYKAFMGWPGWMAWERLLRRAGGLGRAPSEPDPDTYDGMHAHCDVLIIGGGPAGLAAARAAAATDARVILADQQPVFGGRLLDERYDVDGVPGDRWAEATAADLAGRPDVRLLPSTTVFGAYDHGLFGLQETRPAGAATRERLWTVRARRVVLATGAIERTLSFPDNDRPGIMLAGAVRSFVNRYGVAPGRKAVVVTNNDDAYGTALDLADAGIDVAAVVDLRAEPEGPRVDAVTARDITVMTGARVVGVNGGRRVQGVRIAGPLAAGKAAANRIDCDLVCVSGGWSPTVQLYRQAGGVPRYDAATNAFVPGASVANLESAGAAAGTFGLGRCLTDGHDAGLAAAAAAGFSAGDPPHAPTAESVPEGPPGPLWVEDLDASRPEEAKTFVDLHNDVTVADLRLAVREGYASAELAKRYTTLGMGTDQGKTGAMGAAVALAAIRQAPVAKVGVPTARPPVSPVTIGAFAGRAVGSLYEPARRTPMQDWHEAAGAVFEDVGAWRRPRYYPRRGETMRQAVDRECLAARNACGLLDASTLGKIHVQGPDATELLNRVYVNRWDTLAVGRCRYGVMCTEDGMVFDDGVTTRLGRDAFLMTTTTGNAARVLSWLEEWVQTEWTDLDVTLTSVTETWAVATVCGPLARSLLAMLAPSTDLEPAVFPAMTVQGARVADIPARIFRVSFTGECSYEINVPARYGMALWTALINAGERFGLTPFGTEAMHVLRAEKGYIMIGQETDGSVTPIDLGMARMVSRKKDFLGRRSLTRADTQREDRKQLVGLLAGDSAAVPPEGAPVVAEVGRRLPMPTIGHVTSAYHSANLGRSIALALVGGGRQRVGQQVFLPLPAGTLTADVVPPTFFDPEGSRLDG